jgi:hypothetical protein
LLLVSFDWKCVGFLRCTDAQPPLPLFNPFRLSFFLYVLIFG